MIFPTDSTQFTRAESLAIPDEELSKYMEIARWNNVSHAQDMDYTKENDFSGDGFNTVGVDPFLVGVHGLESTVSLQLDSAGMLFDDSTAVSTSSSNASMVFPNMETIPPENGERSTGSDVNEYAGEYYVESPNTLHTCPPVSYTENTISRELSGSSSASINGNWQAAEETESRSSRNTSPAQSVSHTAWPFGPANSDSNNGQAVIDCTAGTLPDAAMQKVISAARTCIRSDYLSLLEMNLQRWATDGLWHKTVSPPYQRAGRCEYEKLQKAYSCLCRLDMRMKDDAIRSRMAMVLLHLEYENTYVKWKRGAPGGMKPITEVGRGTISSMIDDILENTHPQWKTAGSREKSQLRANFHERKRFGKRWWILINALGPSILILCSSKFAAIIKNTTITAKMLEAIGSVTRETVPHVINILELLNPIAENLIRDRGYKRHDVTKLLQKARAFDKRFGDLSKGDKSS
ncbi:hypothetical protein J3458_016188 [Metarhizium acridum]|uniref:uncharacterized protein n=1 Tax=Metarhizium acridum TaxID=92637 RepID=UPI001C6C9F21|nr:hypothetical protein J3458_016188 [Metarhizium acridum]